MNAEPRKRRGRPSAHIEWPQLYTANLPITMAKKNDLLDLCKASLIPEEYQPWIM